MQQADNGVRIRESVWSLPQWDDTLLWYARAVKEMWNRPLNDPTSWRYQAAVHGYDASNPWLQALEQPGEQHPTNELDVWSQCQHGSWYFLPWHRGYLGCFEAIVLEAIKSLGGPHEDWALPYWNYSDGNDPNARLVRPEFLDSNWPDGNDNPLFVGVERAPWTQVQTPLGMAGDFVLEDEEVSLGAMNQSAFAGPANATSFGGRETGFSFSGNRGGVLERTPHGDVHMSVGFDSSTGDGFWMGSFMTAGLDPIFWLHHCNLDRLWTAWVLDPANSGNPTKAKWRNPSSQISGQRMPFILHHPTVADYRLIPADVVDSSQSVFAYRYDDEPLVPPGAPSPFEMAIVEELEVSKEEPNLVGATSRPVVLEGDLTSAKVAVAPPPPTEPGLMEAEAVPARTYLSIENIVAEGPAVPYRVYLKKAEGGEQQLVGTLPMFGVREASRAESHTGGSGLDYVFDVTDVLERIGPQNEIEVVFAPKSGKTPAAIKVGKIGFYRE